MGLSPDQSIDDEILAAKQLQGQTKKKSIQQVQNKLDEDV